MNNEEFDLSLKEQKIPKRKSYLKKGDEIWIVSSEGFLIDKTRVERIMKSYVVAKGNMYWVRGLDGKHRNRNNYLQFAMKPKDALKYLVKEERRLW